MAERINNLSPIRPRKYPWDEWTDGSAWLVRRGQDFDVSATSMAAMVRLHAKAAGLTATCRIPDEDTVEFQFTAVQEEAA